MKVDALNVSFGYSAVHPVVDSLSLSVRSSETVSIVGPSGSGKSTLLRLLCGLLPQSAEHHFTGQVLINGHDIAAEPAYWAGLRSKGKVGFMFQEAGLLPDRSVAENILLPLRILGRHDEGQRAVSHYVAQTGLEEAKTYLPAHLSGGMRTRAALARTLITGPELLLLDEPFSSLDVLWKARLYSELLALKEELQTTVVLVTHDIFEALFFSPRLLILREGKSLLEFSAKGWSQPHSYDEVVQNYSDAFLEVKALMSSGSQEGP